MTTAETTTTTVTFTPIPCPGRFVRLGRPLKSNAGNIIANAGVHELVEAEEMNRYGRISVSYTISTPEHYAGCKRSSFRPRRGDVVIP